MKVCAACGREFQDDVQFCPIDGHPLEPKPPSEYDPTAAFDPLIGTVLDDKYRLGEVNDGWTVVREPLNVEHGAVEAAADGLQDVSIMMHQAGFMAAAVDTAAAKVAEPGPDGRRLIDDGSVAYRLGRSVARSLSCAAGPVVLRNGGIFRSCARNARCSARFVACLRASSTARRAALAATISSLFSSIFANISFRWLTRSLVTGMCPMSGPRCTLIADS